MNNFKRDRLFEAGEVLYHQGDSCNGIFCIREGLVGERRLTPEGNTALVRLDHAGTTLGYQEFLTRTAYRNTAEVLQRSHICFLSRSLLGEMLAKNPSLGERFLHRSIEDLGKMEDRYVHVMNRDIRSRLLHALLAFYERYGHFEETRGHVIEIPIARHDLASLVGTGPETISRTIRKLQEDRLVTFDGRIACFPDLDDVYDEVAGSD